MNLIFTGGGSGGHVIPALTIIKEFESLKEYQIYYVGGENSIEKDLLKITNLTYIAIKTGKLRRYFSIQNFLDIFKIFFGLLQSICFLIRFRSKTTLIFSTGGFVSVPMVVAGFLLRKKIYIHEQTSRVGLANKLASKLASKIFISFEDSRAFFPAQKTFYSGYPLRDSCFDNKIGQVVLDGKNINSISKDILFITGGGNGAQILNVMIKDHLEQLKKRFFIIHQVGKNFINEYQQFNDDNYLAMPFVGEEIIELYKMAKVVISRAGAGTVCELLALSKRSIFIPLKIAQKNEQFFNALEAQKILNSKIIIEDDLKKIDIVSTIEEFILDKDGDNSRIDRINPKIFLVNQIKDSYRF